MDDDICGHTPTTTGEPCQNPAGSCPWHDTANPPKNGRPSKYEDHNEEILKAARDGLTVEGCANMAGVDKQTLYNWLDKHDDFFDAFQRARAEGQQRLIRAGLEGEADTRMVQFLLERSHGYTKTQEIDHTLEGDGIVFNFNEPDE